jgi:hypothetical protein
MHKPLFAMLVSLGLMGCFPDPPTGGGGGGGGGGTPDAGGGACTLTTAAGNSTPGFPYDVTDFNTNILPPLRTGCLLSSGCHGPGNSTKFTVQPETGSTSTCPEIESFNSVVAQSNYMLGGTMSPLVQKINGTLGHVHPSTSPASMQMTTLFTAFIDTAKTNFEMGGGGGGDGGVGGGGGSFDQTAYANQVHPILSNSGCINTGCHNIEQGNISGDFGLHPRALAGSTDLTENIATIATRIDTSLPAAQANTTVFYVYCTNSHAGAVVGNTQAIADWIATGLVQ